MTDLDNIIIEKIPSLTCKKCGSIRVIMTDEGPECEDCDIKSQSLIELSRDIEYFIYQLGQEETEDYEAF